MSETRKPLFDFNDPFFRPLWIRVLTVGVPAVWALLEFAWGKPFWGMISGAMAALAFHGLFITFDPRKPEPKDKNRKGGK